MSDLLAAAAAALGTPEALVKRAAEARAAATGASVDEILAAWGDGADVPSGPPAATEEGTADDAAESETSPTPPETTEATPPQPVPAFETESPPTPVPVATGPYKPPILVGAVDNPLAVLAGVVGLFLLVLLVGLVGPSIPTDIPGARSSEINFTEHALQGQVVYLKMGCAACHTQMIRPVVADVGLGPVSLNDTNQVLGTRRFGPDLAEVGARASGDEIRTVVGGGFGHPAHNLSSTDMAALIAYLTKEESGS